MSFIKLSFLGEGSHAKVRFAMNRPRVSLYPHDDNPSPLPVPTFAVKYAPLEFSYPLEIEGRFLYLFRHNPYILHCYGEDISMEKNDEPVYNLLLEYASHGSLKNLINKYRKLPEVNVKRFARMILKGLSYVHSMGYVHCDIKPQNILIFSFGLQEDLDGVVKIADFGLAKKASDTRNQNMLEGGLGLSRATPLYASPESIEGLNEAPMDIWAFGCTVAEMLTGKLYKNCDVSDYLDISSEALTFLSRCLFPSHEHRWTANKLLTDPFVALTSGSDVDEDKYAARYQYHFTSKPWISRTDLFRDDTA